jgi:hypothetical protein
MANAFQTPKRFDDTRIFVLSAENDASRNSEFL